MMTLPLALRKLPSFIRWTRWLPCLMLLAACPAKNGGSAEPARQAQKVDGETAAGQWVPADGERAQGGIGRPVHAAGPKLDEAAAKGTGEPCGPKRCAPGEVCCNASCGICTPPGSMCTQQMCESKPSSCAKDADCRTFSDYCTGCDCRALMKSEGDPTCSGPGVRCAADPCQKKQAVCRAGRCALVTGG